MHNCESRARSFKGSSSNAPQSFWPYSGPMDASASTNPLFADFHRLHLHYCDGSSFSGDRADPVLLPDGKTSLYFRGKRVLQAQIAAALEIGMRDASEVLLCGGSAGGIGAMHAAPWMRAAIPKARRFKVLVLSGFFLDRRSARDPLHEATAGRQAAAGSRAHGSTEAGSTEGGARDGTAGPEATGDMGGDIRGRRLSRASAVPWRAARAASGLSTGHAAEAADEPDCRRGHAASTNCVPWVAKMRHMCELHNCTGALVEGGCGAELPPTEQWRCLFGRHAAAGLRLPTFFINSAIDAWQMVNVWRRFTRCRWDGVAGCTSQMIDADIDETNRMLRAFVLDLRVTGALKRPGNGAFITSCNEHVAGLSSRAYSGYRIGETSMQHALLTWWSASDDAPSAPHVHLPCQLVRNGSITGRGGRRLSHNSCNPSCDTYKAVRRMRQECPCSP